MRCENIKIKLSIPVPIDKPDGNGNMYSEDAISKACENANELPIVQFDMEGNELVIGLANNIRYVDGYIEADGYVWHGGTCELSRNMEKKYLSDISFTSIGFSL